MKKSFLVLGFVLSMLGTSYCQEFKRPVYQPLTLNAMTIYVVASTTFNVCKADVSASSLTVRCTGLSTKATGYTLSAYTIDQAISFLNSNTSLVTGGDGAIYCTKPQMVYGDQTCDMFTQGNYSCRNSSYTQTITLDTTLGMSYILTPPSNTAMQYRLGDLVTNATFNSGASCNVNIYESTAAVSSAQVRKETFVISGVDASLDTSDWFNESVTKTWRFDVVCSTNMTAGYLNFTYYIDISK